MLSAKEKYKRYNKRTNKIIYGYERFKINNNLKKNCDAKTPPGTPPPIHKTVLPIDTKPKIVIIKNK